MIVTLQKSSAAAFVVVQAAGVVSLTVEDFNSVGHFFVLKTYLLSGYLSEWVVLIFMKRNSVHWGINHPVILEHTGLLNKLLSVSLVGIIRHWLRNIIKLTLAEWFLPFIDWLCEHIVFNHAQLRIYCQFIHTFYVFKPFRFYMALCEICFRSCNWMSYCCCVLVMSLKSGQLILTCDVCEVKSKIFLW